MSRVNQRHLTILIIVIILAAIVLSLYTQPLNNGQKESTDTYTWHTMGWEPCIEGRHAVIKACLNRSTGVTVEKTLCPQPEPVEYLTCESGKRQRVTCCASDGDCEKNWLYSDGYRCCGKTYNDYNDNGTYQCCHHGNDKFPDGCAVSPGNACAACGV